MAYSPSRKPRNWCAAGKSDELMVFIWSYDRKFGHPPTSARIKRGAGHPEKVDGDLAYYEECGWIRLHRDREKDIEIVIPLSKGAKTPERYRNIAE